MWRSVQHSQTEVLSPVAQRPPVGYDPDQSVDDIIRKTLREAASEEESRGGSTLSDIHRTEISQPRNAGLHRSSAQYTHLKERFTPVVPAFSADLDRTADIRSGAMKRHSAFDIYPPSLPGRLPASDGLKPAQRHSVSGIALELDNTEDMFERLCPGEGLDTAFDSDDLPHLPTGFHQRHDSLEHLRDDDSPQEPTLQDLCDADAFLTGEEPSTFTDGGEPSEVEATLDIKNNTQRVKPDGSVENRFRTPGPTGRQRRPINIERNDCDSNASSTTPGAHDNTSANVNLNYQTGAKLTVDSSRPYQVRVREWKCPAEVSFDGSEKFEYTSSLFDHLFKTFAKKHLQTDTTLKFSNKRQWNFGFELYEI